MNDIDLEWLRAIWCAPAQSLGPVTWWLTWVRIRASIAILLGRWDEALLKWDAPGTELAYLDAGTYMTDYGEGHAFRYLKVDGFRVAEGSDGTL